jgi:hypothetical protein
VVLGVGTRLRNRSATSSAGWQTTRLRFVLPPSYFLVSRPFPLICLLIFSRFLLTFAPFRSHFLVIFARFRSMFLVVLGQLVLLLVWDCEGTVRTIMSLVHSLRLWLAPSQHLFNQAPDSLIGNISQTWLSDLARRVTTSTLPEHFLTAGGCIPYRTARTL